ncbi:DNase I-like protein [Poronia punctata]|nr:DNase I-like protein [Poronia punctata]
MTRAISPPPLRRKGPRHETNTSGATVKAGTLRIFAWNVNGIAPLATPYLRRDQEQKSIRSFLTASGKRRRGDTGPDYEEEGKREAVSEDERLRTFLKRHGWPHVLFLQEVKIRRGDTKIMDAVRVAVNDTSGHLGRGIAEEMAGDGGPLYDVHFNLPYDPYNAKGFGGRLYGVAAVIRRDFARSHVDTIRDVPWDKEGRVQVIETKPLTFPLIALINIYAVNGTPNPYRSIADGTTVIGTRHDRKLAVHYELLREARHLEERGFAVVIAGDLNVAPDARDGYPRLRTWPPQHARNRADFHSKFFGCGKVDNIEPGVKMALLSGDTGGEEEEEEMAGFDGIDSFRAVHGDARRYSYYPRTRDWGTSCDRVDLILLSRPLGNVLVDAGICDNPRDRGPSDHCPVWVELGGG